MRWDYPLLDINQIFPGLGEIIIIIIIIIFIVVIIINHLFHFNTSILHGSLSKTKIYGS